MRVPAHLLSSSKPSMNSAANLGSWLRYMMGERLAPYVPAPSVVGTTMLELASLQPGEVVVDLGCGDGRLLRQAVHEFGASQAVGYELDAALVADARELNGDDPRLIVRHEDALQAADDLSQADVVALYLTERCAGKAPTRAPSPFVQLGKCLHTL